MIKILTNIITNLMMIISLLYVWHKLLNRKINFKDYKLYITSFCIMIISMYNYIIVNKFFRIFLLTVIFMFFFKFLFKETLQKSIITPILYQLIVMIIENIYAMILFLIINKNFESFLDTTFGLIITNFIISLFTMIFAKTKMVTKLYKWLLDLTDKLKKMQIMPLCLILVIILNIADMTIYYTIKFQYLVIFNVLIIIVCFTIAIYSLRTQNKYNKVSDKYNIAINSLNEYEKMMTNYRIANHENKNLLLTIRTMIVNKEKKIPEYIDSLIQCKYEDNEKLLFEMNVIPSGGLRATIYSEILKIKENNISYNLNIDKNLRTIDLIELNTNTIIDICKIIGVFIDNAIEETINIKNGEIGISLYVEENNIIIKVSNNYRGNIEISKIYSSGYTTKGNGHGYGLPLVKRIVDNNKCFENDTEISKTVFSQILKINLKKDNK